MAAAVGMGGRHGRQPLARMLEGVYDAPGRSLCMQAPKPLRKRRLDDICCEQHPEYSRNVIQSFIAQGAPPVALSEVGVPALELDTLDATGIMRRSCQRLGAQGLPSSPATLPLRLAFRSAFPSSSPLLPTPTPTPHALAFTHGHTGSNQTTHTRSWPQGWCE